MFKDNTHASSAGGRAGSIGTEYQSRVAAWFCVQILLEQGSISICDQSAGVNYEIVETQTNEEIDDLNVINSNGEKLLLNIKHKVNNSQKLTSDFAKALQQIVRQYLKEIENDNSNFKMVLVTSSNSSNSIKTDLKSLLNRIRHTPNQNLSSAHNNKKEESVLENIRRLIQHFWFTETNKSPSEKDIKNLLKKIWVEILDVDSNGNDERNSLFFLKSGVITNADDANKVWESLISFCLTLNSFSGGVNLQIIQSHLTKLDFALESTQSFLPDIKKLKKYSLKTLRSVRELSLIRIGDKELKINRPVKEALHLKAESESVVLVGEPGSGKSGVLYDFIEDLYNSNKDFVFLAIDRIEANNSISFHQELRIDNDLQEIFQNWVGTEPAYLVIDALDASRDPEKAKFIHNIIEDLLTNSTRWRVIVSIREFDLRYNSKLHKLFEGTPTPEYTAQEFNDLSHIKVSGLTIDELLQIPQQSEELTNLFIQANDALRELLFSPFNLKIFGELIGSGTKVDELSPIQTQIELLERYWQERVIGTDGYGDSREFVLSKTVNQMVSSRRMQINRQDLITSNDKTLQDILSRNIMSEWKIGETKSERNVLNFSHHIIFDYAVSRLFLRGTENTLIEKLENDRELVMAIRPSIVLHFQYWANINQNFFWQQIFQTVKSSKIPSIGKLIGSSVAAETAKIINFFKPLIKLLRSRSLSEKEIAETTLRYIITSLRVSESYSPGYVLKDENELWTDFLEILSEKLTPFIAHDIRILLWDILRNNSVLTINQRNSIGLVSRRILEFALSLNNYDYALTTSMITHICKMYDSDPVESKKLLLKIIEPSHVLEHGYQELRFFSDEISTLASSSPELIEELYRVAFTYFDGSDEKTSISNSRIIGMTSTRKQDFGLARFSLNSKFKEFLEQKPINAVRCLIEIIDVFIKQRNYNRFGFSDDWNEDAETKLQKVDQIETFTFRDKKVNFIFDRRDWWSDSLLVRQEKPLQMLETFKYFIEDISKDNNNEILLAEILDLIAERNQGALFWKVILECGAVYPETIGKEIRSLAWSMPILLSGDTSRTLGEYLRNNFSRFNEKERELTESAILSMPENSKGDKDKFYRENDRNRLLGWLPEEYLTTYKAKEILDKIKKENSVPQNIIPQSVGMTAVSPNDEEEYFRKAGIDLKDGNNQPINEIGNSLKAFAGKFLNENPNLSDAKPIVPKVRKLFGLLTKGDNEKTSRIILENAWRNLVGVCEKIARIQGIEKETKTFPFLREVFLFALDNRLPEKDQISEEQFDDYNYLGCDSERGDATQGLLWLANSSEGADSEILGKIEQLALYDPVSSVRFNAITDIKVLYYTAPDLMWKIIERASADETSIKNAIWFTRRVLQSLARHYPEKVFKLTTEIYRRFKDAKNSDELRKECTLVFVILAFNLKHSESWTMLENFINNPSEFGSEIDRIIMDAGEYLNLGFALDTNAKGKEIEEYVRFKSFYLLEKCCHFVYQAFLVFRDDLSEKVNPEWSEEEIEKYKQFHHLIDFIITKVFFASGAYNEKYEKSGKEIPMDEESRLQFFNESKKVLFAIAETGFADVIHRLVETLRFFLPYNPEQVFLILSKAVESGKKDAYQFESLAVTEIAAIVKRVFAEYKYILKENEECRDGMIEILDTFVDAGWIEAQKLTYRLEEIFR